LQAAGIHGLPDSGQQQMNGHDGDNPQQAQQYDTTTRQIIVSLLLMLAHDSVEGAVVVCMPGVGQ
jgi:hypothetical protein